VRTSSDAIDDNQCVSAVNMVSESNKLTTISWYVQYLTPWTWVTRWQAIALYWDYTLSIHNRNLYVTNTVTWTVYTQATAVANAVDIYKIIVSKSFSTWKMSIVIINSNLTTVENVTAYEFDWTTFTSPSWIWFTDRNFKCGTFHDGKLLLGGHPSFPANLYYSKTWWVLGAAATNIYDFSWYNSNFQVVGDSKPIVNILSNTWELWVAKANWWHKNTWTVDNWTAFLFTFKQESSTWPLNTHCVVPVEKDIFYFDWISLRRLSYEQNILWLSDSNISKDVFPIINSLPKNQTYNATMYYCYPSVKLFLRDKYSNDNQLAIVYDVVDNGYAVQTWLNCVQGVGWFVNNRHTAYFISSQTSTIYEDNVWGAYNAGNINFSHKSKRYVLWDWVDYKRITQVELYGKITPWLTANIDIYVNWVIIDTRSIYYSEELSPTTWTSLLWNTLFGANDEEGHSLYRDFVVRYEYFNDGRDFQFWIRGNWQWRFELHWLNLMYKSIKAYDIHS